MRLTSVFKIIQLVPFEVDAEAEAGQGPMWEIRDDPGHLRLEAAGDL